ncbi:MAG: 50S ribosomal protein L29 [Bacilli bacterium]|nr:50S ribosomal protein L29 [Bacilli bacterium]MDD3304796.1 50S ribosomal protein L29 [Bacilli bacterium]MDD4053382.1 50S ribosomal protein L29 [Bacilli bacterium]MDD4410971.1 50S ribosomal protein L29 [Bacilli bacterium]
MKVNEIRDLTTEDIIKRIKDSKEELFNLRFKQANGSLEKPHRINELRKDIARAKTIIRERELKEDRGVKS